MKIPGIALALLALSGATAIACGNKSNVQAYASDPQVSTATIESTKPAETTTVVK